MDSKFNIFLATDYSEAVMNAERYAFEIAKKTGSNLSVLHVYEIPFSFPIEPDEYISASERLRKFELQKLKVHCEMLLRTLNIKQNEIDLECIVLEGNIGKEIRKEAEHNRPDFIITGVHNSEEAPFFGSSHTWDIIKKSNVPILSVPPYALLSDIKKIVFATNYREGEISGIKSLTNMAKKFGAELVVLHITNHTITREFESLIFKKFKEEILNNVDYEKLSLRVIYSEDILEGLNDFCLSAKADWLVMSHSRSFFFEKILAPGKSFTKEMSLKTNIPLLSIPDYYTAEVGKYAYNTSETMPFNRKTVN